MIMKLLKMLACSPMKRVPLRIRGILLACVLFCTLLAFTNWIKANRKHRLITKCEKWAVVTTIYQPSEAIRQVSSPDSDWCVVVVLDKKSPSDFVSNLHHAARNITVLDVDWQTNICEYEICQLLPWNHFGRKNIGYLYAIEHGAKYIYDFDDDNVLKNPKGKWFPYIEGRYSEISYIHNAAYNVYTEFGGRGNIWPRGFPLKLIKDKAVDVTDMRAQVPLHNVAVVQSLADRDPDVDAIWRLTKELPYNFDKKAKIVAIGQGSFCPYNAQATVHHWSAFWGLYLPVTVTGRVSDIWRSYFTQRLLWDIGKTIAFTNPWVNHERSVHDNTRDLIEEIDLYAKSMKLIEVLRQQSFSQDQLSERLKVLYRIMQEMGYISENDVTLISAWIRDLQLVGYDFPPLLPKKKYVYLIQAPNISKSDLYSKIKPEKESDLLFLTFEKPDGDIFLPDSTWSKGRNALLIHAASRSAFAADGGYKYYIFLDADVKLRNVNRSDFLWSTTIPAHPFRRLEAFLDYYQPAVGYADYPSGRHIREPISPANTTFVFDHTLLACHKDTLSFLLPYHSNYDSTSWYYSSQIFRFVVALLYNNYRYQANSLSTYGNVYHTGNIRYKHEMIFHKPWSYVKSFLKNDTMNELLKRHLTVEPEPDSVEEQTRGFIGIALRKGSFDYRITHDSIMNNWDRSSSFVKERLLWRTYYPIAKILGSNQ